MSYTAENVNTILIMNKIGPVCRKFFRRHAEAFLIIAFVLADCYLAGWALMVGTLIAVVYVSMPAIRTICTLDPKAHIFFIKSFVKTHKVQRLGLLIFWVFSIRLLLHATCSAGLFNEHAVSSQSPLSISNALILGAKQFAPIGFVAYPILIYLGSCLIAVALRSRLRATNRDPDLIEQRLTWSCISYFLFMFAFVAAILSICVEPHGPAHMLSNWLLASAHQANFFGYRPPLPIHWEETRLPQLPIVDCNGIFQKDLSFLKWFDSFMVGAVSLTAFIFLLHPALRLSRFLTSFCWRALPPASLQNIIEAFLEALRLPSHTLHLPASHPVVANSIRTSGWILLCYGVLFWLFGFCGGPLGYAIQSWMIASARDANAIPDLATWVTQPQFRIFLGSVVASYATAPAAITACVFLPYAKPRQMVFNSDGMLFAQGPYFSLLGRQFRPWCDLKTMTAKRIGKSGTKLKAKLTIRFCSGGSICFDSSQLSAGELKLLLQNIDQYAVACAIDPDVFSICDSLGNSVDDSHSSFPCENTSEMKLSMSNFKSTVFVPFSAGEILPNSQIRVIKQISTRPLCAVYLARNNDGRMLIVKHFYLANDTEETNALRKTLSRECELLSRLNHPGMAKVISSFTVDSSTFLVIEHRLGKDLRATVHEHGGRSESLMVAWAKQLCEIMIYLHGQEPAILHRDLTPDNIIAGNNGQLRLIDFGAAREFLDGITGTMVGKLCYMAPEQLKGEATQQSDIYSFGCTLYFLLTGRDPIALSESSPQKDVGCSDDLDRLIRDCTEFDQAVRPQSFEEVLRRLNSLDQGWRINISRSKQESAA